MAFRSKKARRDFFRKRNKEEKIHIKLLGLLLKDDICPVYHPAIHTKSIDWSSINEWSDPINYMKNDRALRKRQQLENIVGLLRIVPRLAQMNQGSSAGSENRNEHKHDSERGQDDEEKGQTNTKTPIIVDFCSGSGHLGFLIAKTMPHCMVYLVEINTTAAETARRRKAESKMDNIVVFNCGIEDFNERFDVGLGVHACGPLSDLVQLQCFRWNADYVMAPCCVGKVKLSISEAETAREIEMTSDELVDKASLDSDSKHIATNDTNNTSEAVGDDSKTTESGGFSISTQVSPRPPSPSSSPAPPMEKLEYPRSQLYSKTLKREQYFDLASAGDYSGWDMQSEVAQDRRACKSFVEWDRNTAARERHYETYLVRMDPMTCTPKNDMIIGIHQGSALSNGGQRDDADSDEDEDEDEDEDAYTFQYGAKGVELTSPAIEKKRKK